MHAKIGRRICTDVRSLYACLLDMDGNERYFNFFTINCKIFTKFFKRIVELRNFPNIVSQKKIKKINYINKQNLRV